MASHLFLEFYFNLNNLISLPYLLKSGGKSGALLVLLKLLNIQILFKVLYIIRSTPDLAPDFAHWTEHLASQVGWLKREIFKLA